MVLLLVHLPLTYGVRDFILFEYKYVIDYFQFGNCKSIGPET
jgi:hypothetical protein